MKKIGSLSALLLALLVALSACASGPAIKSPEECIVVAKVIAHNPDKVARGRTFYLEFDKDYLPQVLTADYVAIRIKEPGVFINAISSGVKGGYTGERGVKEVSVELPYEAGAILIAPFVFDRWIEKIDETWTRNWITVRPAEPGERLEFETYIRSKPAFVAARLSAETAQIK